MADFADLALGTIACLVFLAIGWGLIKLSRTHAKTVTLQSQMFAMALLVRFAVSVAIYGFGFSSVLGDEDGIGWGYGAWLYGSWINHGFSFFDVIGQWSGAFEFGARNMGVSTHTGYYYLLGTLFFVLGTVSRLTAAVLNCFIGALTVVFAYRTARSLFSEEVARQVGWWTCWFPSMIIWSAQTVKEPVVILLEVIALYGCIQLKRSGFAFRYIVLCGFAIAAVMPFRFYAAYICAAAVATMIVIPLTDQRTARRSSGLGFMVFVGTLIAVSTVLARAEVRVERFDVEFIQQFRKDLAENAGSAVGNFDMQTTAGFTAGTLVGAAHLLLAPFPWQLGGGSLRMLLTVPELLYWWWLVWFGLKPGIVMLARRRFGDVAPMLVLVIGLGLLYSMTFGNVGLVFRQRAQLMPWLFMFAAVGLQQRRLAAVRSRMAPPQSPPPRVLRRHPAPRPV